MTSLSSVLESRYGVSLLAAPVEAIMWAAEHMLKTRRIIEVRAELQAANARRRKAGKVPAYFPWGHDLF